LISKGQKIIEVVEFSLTVTQTLMLCLALYQFKALAALHRGAIMTSTDSPFYCKKLSQAIDSENVRGSRPK